MRLLIYGSKGWIGSQFTSFLKTQNIGYIEGEARVDNIETLRGEFEVHNPSHVFSVIGRTSGEYKGRVINSIDFLEERGNLPLNIRDNLFSPLALAILCREKNIHLTYLGTGCIFNYDNEHDEKTGYRENDNPNFFGSSYSIVKGYTDRLMRLLQSNVLNLRIRMPISAEDHPRNFISKITRYHKICSISNSMTVLPTFFPIFLKMIQKGKTGTYNCTNPGVISHNEILKMYKEIVDPAFKWINFTLKEQDRILVAQRSNNCLDTTKIESEYEIPDIHSAVKEVLIEWKKIKSNKDRSPSLDRR